MRSAGPEERTGREEEMAHLGWKKLLLYAKREGKCMCVRGAGK